MYKETEILCIDLDPLHTETWLCVHSYHNEMFVIVAFLGWMGENLKHSSRFENKILSLVSSVVWTLFCFLFVGNYFKFSILTNSRNSVFLLFMDSDF